VSPSQVEFHDIHKSFGAVRALAGVSFGVLPGEAHAIVGENGAGKSTLLRILAGSVSPDQGELRLRGERLRLYAPRDALAHGIGVVHQEMLAFPDLSVSANVFAGRELRGWGGRLKGALMRERTREVLGRLHLDLSPDATVGTLPPAHRQLLQVARALVFDCAVLALDEPTTALTDAETSHLFSVLDDLRRRGTTLLYVSHRLPEVFRLCDRITVLRDGQHVGTFARARVAPADVVRAMIGRDLPPRGVHGGPRGHTAEALAVSGLSRRPCFEDVSLVLRAGEIVGLFGLVGAGRSELLETLVGLHPPDAGTVRVEGRPARFGSPRAAARAGVVLVPEERQRQGLFFNLALSHNLALPRAMARGEIVLHRGEERRLGESLLADWRIKATSVEARPDTLSGGNQQKVVLARWLATRPRVLLLDEPTKGVDVGAKYEIHEAIRRIAAGGAACLVASSDLPELLGLAQRILVMREGRLRGELPGEQADEEGVMRLATSAPQEAA
jgi:ABC-type sugar transport system ATPase subunit